MTIVLSIAMSAAIVIRSIPLKISESTMVDGAAIHADIAVGKGGVGGAVA